MVTCEGWHLALYLTTKVLPYFCIYNSAFPPLSPLFSTLPENVTIAESNPLIDGISAWKRYYCIDLRINIIM